MPRLVRKKKAGATAKETVPDFVPRARKIGEAAWKLKARDIRAYDVRDLTVVADSLVLCSASSEPQLKAIYTEVKEGMREEGIRALRSEGSFKGGWLVIDFGDIVFHLFREEARQFYDLDGLWGDAPRVDLGVE